MEVKRTAIEGVLEFIPRTFADERGMFRETWSQAAFEAATGISIAFVQDNESRSAAGVVRGLHFQVPPHAQGKLVRCAAGRVLDVVVDLRRGSPTFGQHVKLELSAAIGNQLWIPPGFAHGFAALEPDAVLAYKCTAGYAPESEASLRWDDPDLAIDWGVAAPLLSPKDASAGSWSDFASPFA
jgi:dTDP-4-dehydrorhamnose 3,5-epimerase